MPSIRLHTLLFIAALIISVTAAPTNTAVAELNSTSVVHQPGVIVVPCATSLRVSLVECKGTGSSSSPVTAATAEVLLPDPANLTDAVPSAATSPAVVPIMFMNGDHSLSPSVVGSIVGVFIIFVAFHVALFCLWRRGCRRPRAIEVPLSAPRRHVFITVASAGIHRGPSAPRSSSATLASRASGSEDRRDDPSTKHSELEMLPVARLSGA
ncbi:hypothetical protein C8R44DRAFT_878228 [Mycena epipterygia]|nr:hypothetical protein C8R44DRAFT_878228 [Mycena epipterygia]